MPRYGEESPARTSVISLAGAFSDPTKVEAEDEPLPNSFGRPNGFGLWVRRRAAPRSDFRRPNRYGRAIRPRSGSTRRLGECGLRTQGGLEQLLFDERDRFGDPRLAPVELPSQRGQRDPARHGEVTRRHRVVEQLVLGVGEERKVAPQRSAADRDDRELGVDRSHVFDDLFELAASRDHLPCDDPGLHPQGELEG